MKLEDEISKLRTKLESKEYDLQAREKKWAEVDQILIKYAREDGELREKLDEIQYLCDDLTTARKITTVISQNEDLKTQLEEMRTQLTEYKSNMSQVEKSDEIKMENEMITNHYNCQAKSTKFVQSIHNDLGEERNEGKFFQQFLYPLNRNGGLSSYRRFRGKKSSYNLGNSTKILGKESERYQNPAIKPISTFAIKIPKDNSKENDEFESLGESSISLDESISAEDDQLSPVGAQLEQCLKHLETDES